MDDLKTHVEHQTQAAFGMSSLIVEDPRPTTDDMVLLVEWLFRRYCVSKWDNDFVTRLKMVLKRDNDGNLLPEGKMFRMERKGIAVTAQSQDGKTTMVVQVLKRLFNDNFTDAQCGQKIAYCRLRGDATVKSVCMDLCRTTGYSNFPAKLTRAEANELATYRLRLAGITIVVIDEVHNLMGKNEPVNLFLKTLAQDGGGFCVILIGTPKVQEFIYARPENIEMAERYFDLTLLPFSRDATLELINGAIKSFAHDARISVALNIRKDPYFADRVYDGCRGSYGRCMLLIATSVVRALEEGGNAVDIEDFRESFNLKYLHFNPENPFAVSDWDSRVSAAMIDPPSSADIYFESEAVESPSRKRGRPAKNTKVTK